MYLIVGLVFSRLGFWSGNLFLIAPFPDLCLLVPFAVDNCDFQEDTPDGKNTLHGTVMNIYQSISESDEIAHFAFDDTIEDRKLYDLPKIH